MAYRPQKYVDGLSFYAWVSLVVKSVRLGWPEGIRQAEARIGNYLTKRTAEVQIMEDISPTEDLLPEIQRLVWTANWDELCTYDTHHGRGSTRLIETTFQQKYESYCEDERNRPELEALADIYRFKKPQARIYGDLITWHNLKNELPEMKMRSIDTHPWRGVPIDVLDRHTSEGKRAKRLDTILSGSVEGHLMLADAVQKHGWEVVRDHIHAKEVFKVEPRTVAPIPKQEASPKPVKPKSRIIQSTLLLY